MSKATDLVPSNPHLDPLWLFCLVFIATALSGIAALLRSSSSPLSLRALLTWSLNGGLVGLGLFWFWQKYYAADVWGLIGICILLGLGGPASVDMVVLFARKTLTTVAGQALDKLGKDERTDDSSVKKPNAPEPGKGD